MSAQTDIKKLKEILLRNLNLHYAVRLRKYLT